MDDLARLYNKHVYERDNAKAAVEVTERASAAARARVATTLDNVRVVETELGKSVSVNLPIRVFECGDGTVVVVTFCTPRPMVQLVKIETYKAI